MPRGRLCTTCRATCTTWTCMINCADGSHDQMSIQLTIQQPELCTPGALDWLHMRPNGTHPARAPPSAARSYGSALRAAPRHADGRGRDFANPVYLLYCVNIINPSGLKEQLPRLSRPALAQSRRAAVAARGTDNERCRRQIGRPGLEMRVPGPNVWNEEP